MADVDFTSFDLIGAISSRAAAQGTHSVGFSFDPDQLTTTFLNPSFGTATAIAQPPVEIDSLVDNNDTDAAGTVTFSTQKTFTTTASLQVTRGLTVGASAGFQIKLSDITNLNFSGTLSASYSMQQGSSTSQAQSFTDGFTAGVPARTKVTATCLVEPSKFTVPFSGTVRVQGQVKPFQAIVAAIVVDLPPPLGIGELFRRSSSPMVSVVDGQTIECNISGNVVGVVGTRLEFRPVQTSLDSGAAQTLPARSFTLGPPDR